MQRNTIVALCAVILLLTLGTRSMMGQLQQAVPAVKKTTLEQVQADLRAQFQAQNIEAHARAKTLLLEVKEAQVPIDANQINWLQSYIVQKPGLESVQKYQVDFETAGIKGNYAGSLSR